MTRNLWIIAAIIAIVIISGVVYYYQGQNGAKSPYPANSAAPTQASGAPPVPSSNSSGTYNVSVANFAFSPAVINISQGDTVVWTNNDSAPHQIWGGDFKSGVLSNGQTYSFTFDKSGNFDYNCNIHTYMKGQVVVK